jgi:hypothetical protein
MFFIAHIQNIENLISHRSQQSCLEVRVDIFIDPVIFPDPALNAVHLLLLGHFLCLLLLNFAPRVNFWFSDHLRKN